VSNLTALALGTIGVSIWHNWRAWRRADQSEPVQQARAPVEDWSDSPRVSALVAAWNEAGTIERHMRSFAELDYPARQLILCAGGSDGTYDIAHRMGGDDVSVLRQHEGEGKQRALQRCLEASDGEIIMLTDADCLFSGKAFRRLVQPIARGEADVVTGYRMPLPEQRGSAFTRPQWLAEAASEGARHHVNGLWGGNCAIRREAIEQTGIFLEQAATGTDYVQARTLLNAGYKIEWIPDSRVETRYPTDVSSYLQTWRRWIKNILIHGPRLGDWRGTSETVVAVTLAAGTLLTPLLAPVSPRVAALAPATALSVATLNRMRRLAIGSRMTGSPLTWRLLAAAPAFAVLDQLATLLAAYDALSHQGRTRW
jgi:cellulose synthase/poly-beta-1,6-N-acetylglucosamine synthase-like glycosyltransferase